VIEWKGKGGNKWRGKEGEGERTDRAGGKTPVTLPLCRGDHVRGLIMLRMGNIFWARADV